MTADQKLKEIESLEAWIAEKAAAGNPVHPKHEIRGWVSFLKKNPKTDPWSAA
jgi:hypothetical protein